MLILMTEVIHIIYSFSTLLIVRHIYNQFSMVIKQVQLLFLLEDIGQEFYTLKQMLKLLKVNTIFHHRYLNFQFNCSTGCHATCRLLIIQDRCHVVLRLCREIVTGHGSNRLNSQLTLVKILDQYRAISNQWS